MAADTTAGGVTAALKIAVLTGRNASGETVRRAARGGVRFRGQSVQHSVGEPVHRLDKLHGDLLSLEAGAFPPETRGYFRDRCSLCQSLVRAESEPVANKQ